jgi:adenylate cyclase
MVLSFAMGVAYRYFFDDPGEARLANYMRSGLHAVGLTLAGWIVHVLFTSRLRGSVGRLPLLIQLVARTGTMTLVLTAVAIVLQAILYGATVERRWLVVNLPTILAISLVASFLVGAMFELTRLIGSRAIASFVLGTYHRPLAEERILMFLDLAGSTALAERMGELRVHNLITRFFFDIDEAIASHGGEVHAYVGDAVVVTWRLEDALRNARSLRCFFAIEDVIAERAGAYQREFDVVPSFRAGLHAGWIVISECGSAKRQIAYFGDAVNVAARLQEHCKVADRNLIVSADLLARLDLPRDLEAESLGRVALRGREAPVALHAVRRRVRMSAPERRPEAAAC